MGQRSQKTKLLQHTIEVKGTKITIETDSEEMLTKMLAEVTRKQSVAATEGGSLDA